MTHNYIYSKEIYEQPQKMIKECLDSLAKFKNIEVEIIVQGDQYTTLIRYVTKIIDFKLHESTIQDGHLLAHDFFIYIINSSAVHTAIPIHQIINITLISKDELIIECQAYKFKIRKK